MVLLPQASIAQPQVASESTVTSPSRLHFCVRHLTLLADAISAISLLLAAELDVAAGHGQNGVSKLVGEHQRTSPVRALDRARSIRWSAWHQF